MLKKSTKMQCCCETRNYIPLYLKGTDSPLLMRLGCGIGRFEMENKCIDIIEGK